MHPRSLLKSHWHRKIRADVDYTIKTKISTISAKSEAKAGLAYCYYIYDNSYCRINIVFVFVFTSTFIHGTGCA